MDVEREMDKETEPMNDRSAGPSPDAGDAPAIVLASEALPNHLPLLVLRSRPFFPGFPVPLTVDGPQLLLIKKVLQSDDHSLGLVLARNAEAGDRPANLYRVGVGCKIVRVVQEEADNAHLLINCMQRFTIRRLREEPEGLYAIVEYHQTEARGDQDELRAYSMALVSTLKELVQLDPLQSEAIKLFLSRSSLDNPGRLADLTANLTSASGSELQEVLEIFDVRDRLETVLGMLKKELELTRLQKKITSQIEEKISAQQREFFLREQLKAIKAELGLEKEGKTAEIETFQSRLKEPQAQSGNCQSRRGRIAEISAPGTPFP